MSSPTVSLVITSCNRFDLLEETLRSFFRYNTYPIAQHIIIEDSPYRDKLLKMLTKFPDVEFTVLDNVPQIGQMKSIERAYSEVTSEYIFHCEDDWEFYREAFIEDSMAVLETDDKIITVWLREDLNKNRLEPEVISTARPGVEYQYVTPAYVQPKKGTIWHGFTFNPGLRRYKDYLLVKPISQFDRESTTGKAYFDLGFTAAALTNPYLRHIGFHRGIRFKPHQSQLAKDMQASWRRFKTKLLKAMGLD